MKRLWLLFALALTATLQTGLAQSEAEIQSDEVKRVGTHLACQCGACTENLNCMMSAGQCHFCKPARTKIYNMQKSGMDDAAIIASFVTEYGEKIFRRDPNNYFWLIPYISLALGGVVIVMILKSIRGHGGGMKPAVAGAPPVDDPEFAKYRDAIEKETSGLE